MTIPPSVGRGTTREDMRRDTLRPSFAEAARPLGEIELVPHFEPLLLQRTHVLPAKMIADAFGIPMAMIYGRGRTQSKLIRTPSAPEVLASLREKGWEVRVQHLRFARDLETGTTLPCSMHDWRSTCRDATYQVPTLTVDGEGVLRHTLVTTVETPKYLLLQKGGLTQVEIYHPESLDQLHFKGQALCHPNDNFCKSDGLILALERALKDAVLPWKL